MSEHTLKLVDAQAGAPFEALSESVRHTVRQAAPAVVQAFYEHMLADPQAASFLALQSVEERLKPSLQRWIEVLVDWRDAEGFDRMIAMQQQVGEVHARARIPIHLVARAMRLLKREFAAYLSASESDRDQRLASTLQLHSLLDIAFEAMSASFVDSNEQAVRGDEAYRLFASGQQLLIDREKQISSLLEWENQLFRAIALGMPAREVPSLGVSAFGLWLRHKAPLVFDRTRELPLSAECMARLEALQQGAPALDLGNGRNEATRAWVQQLFAELQQLKYLLGCMFEQISGLEVGRDPLTQVFNRRFLPTILKREIALHREHGIRFSVLMLDIDHFKQINDRLGHQAGDAALQHLASLIMETIRGGDFVFRYGGEEFLVVLAESDASDAALVAEKIRARVAAHPLKMSSRGEIALTVSMGVAGHDGHPDLERLIERADKAMYEAKQGGRNQVCIAP